MKMYAVQVSNMNTRNWDTIEVFKTRKEAERRVKLLAPTYARIAKICSYVR